MSKKRSSRKSVPYATFRKLIVTLADDIGRHQIPIVESAMHPASLITSDAIHYELVKSLFRKIYRANNCYHVNAPVYFHSTFDAIGSTYGEILNSSTSDVDQVSLIQNIGDVAVDFFKTYDSYPSMSGNMNSGVETDDSKGTVKQLG